MPPKRTQWVILAVLTTLLFLATAVRVVYLRRQARLNDFYQAWYEKKAAAHHDAARDCANFGGDRMRSIAQEYQDLGDAEARRAADHGKMAKAYWRCFWQPWLTPPFDPGSQAPP